MIRRPRYFPLFPSTTLSRSNAEKLRKKLNVTAAHRTVIELHFSRRLQTIEAFTAHQSRPQPPIRSIPSAAGRVVHAGCLPIPDRPALPATCFPPPAAPSAAPDLSASIPPRPPSASSEPHRP